MNNDISQEMIISFPSTADDMDFTGERYVPGVSGQIQFEHLHRYLLAATYAHGRDILDIACGEGYGAAALAQFGRTTLGVDIAADAVAHASRRYGNGNLRFSQGSITAIPAEDASFDLIACFETLEHVAEQAEAMRELRRVLRPGGLVIISTPNRNAGDGAWHEGNPFHKKELSEEEFRDLLGMTFGKVAMLEQRFVHGSVIASSAPTAGPTQLLTSDDLSTFRVTQGTIGRYYFIALASDADLPAPFPVSLFDGSKDLVRLRDEFTYSVGRIKELEEEVRQHRIHLQLQKIQIDFLRKKLVRPD